MFFYNQNNSVEVEHFNFSAPEDCAGLRILHLSDIHLPKNAGSVDSLLEKAAGLKPDLIALTGDTVDMDADISSCGLDRLIEGLCAIAPAYAVLGNHEHRNAGLEAFKNILAAKGAVLLSGESALFEKDGTKLIIMGLDNEQSYDPDVAGETDGLPILLLAHHPEEPLFSSYFPTGERAPFLVLTGHAHGGQIRLPFIGGLYAPDQGPLPKYTSGLYQGANGAYMLLSRGLGNSRFPQRLFNRPHMPVIDLRTER